ncbi:MAG: alpha/beta hydrolase, partial [Bacteroidaceae bacterium]|nr:alpha/beta hydrolase [Bacteroidaceae bacterium]
MNIRKLLFLLLTFTAIAAQAQVQANTALIGSWSGKLKVGSSALTLVFHIEQADGYTIVRMDSPDQSAKGIPVL